VFVVFVFSGLLFATWVSRIVSVKAALHVDPQHLGFVLLSISAGSVCALPTAGAIVGRLGARHTLLLAPLVSAVGLAIAGLASAGPIILLAVGLAVMGLGYGVWDVAMNVVGAVVERRLRRALMPRLHAGYSLGTVLGAGLGAGLDALGVAPRIHLVSVAVLLGIASPLVVRTLPPDAPGAAAPAARGRTREAWREPRTIAIGLFMLCLAFAEGTGNDWLSVATVDGYHQSTAVGSAVFGVFVTAMTIGRLSGTRLLDRFGRVPVLRGTCVVAIVGVVLVVTGTSFAFAVAGAVCWGLGASLGFPVGVSAAADDPAREAARVGVVASIAYTAFLAGPPLVGLLGQHAGVKHGVLIVAAVVLAGFALAARTRPLAVEPTRSTETATLA
jgi:MFS family permease